MKKIICTLALSVFCGLGFAQNSAIYKAQAQADKGDIKGAVTILEEALSNPKTTKFAEIYNKVAELNAQIFNPELMKAAQGLPFDTTLFVNTLDKMVNYYTKSHEADVAPDEKGRVKPKFVAANHGRMMSLLDYYNYAALFMNQNKQLKKSAEYFDKYLKLPRNPIFSQHETDSIYASKHNAYAQTAVNIVMLNYQMKDWDGVLSSVEEALKDTVSLHDLYLLKMQAHLEKKDSAAYLKDLQEAIARTNNAGFAQNLLYHYYSRNLADEGLAMARDLVEKNPGSKTSWYMLGCVELNLKKDYEGARKSFTKALEIDPNFIEANANMAYSYMNEVVAKKQNNEFKFIGTNKLISSKEKAAYEKELALVKGYYEKALPYIEKVRELHPDAPKEWASALQQIYSNLGQKEKAKEMDTLLENANAAGN